MKRSSGAVVDAQTTRTDNLKVAICFLRVLRVLRALRGSMFCQ